MLQNEVLSINAALGKLLPRVSTEDAETIRLCRRNLTQLAEQARELETRLIPTPLATRTPLPAEGVM